MFRIIDEPGTGKTRKLIQIAKENNGVILCENPNLLREKAYSYGITGIDFLSFEEYFVPVHHDHMITLKDRPIYIDEISKFILLYDKNFAGYTETIDNWSEL